MRCSPSVIPSLGDLLAEDEYEVHVRRRRVRRKRAGNSTSKQRRSLRLAAKEEPFHVDATSKATRVKTAQLDLARASARMKEALARCGVMEAPAADAHRFTLASTAGPCLPDPRLLRS